MIEQIPDVENNGLESPFGLMLNENFKVIAIPSESSIPNGIVGEYKRNILFVVQLENDATWYLKSFKQLRKTIKSIRIKRQILNYTDVGFCNLPKSDSIKAIDFLKDKDAKMAIFFIDKWPFQEIEVRNFETFTIGETKILRLPTMAEVKSNTDFKRNTWEAIKRYFDM